MNTTKLSDSLPWEPNAPPSNGRTILICDSVETDGRFLLHTLAAQYLSLLRSSKTNDDDITTTTTNLPPNHQVGRVLWIACGSITERQIRMALKKTGCDVTSSGGGGGGKTNDKLCVISAALEVATTLLERNDAENVSKEQQGTTATWDEIDSYVRTLYRRISTWIDPAKNDEAIVKNTSPTSVLVVMDDVSSFKALFGELATFALVQKLRSSRNVSCVAIRCSLDFDQERLLMAASSSGVNAIPAKGIGAGGDFSITEDAAALWPVWERNLFELSDGIVDVIPLISGLSREAHGRLVFTERLGGRGWCDFDETVSSSGRSEASFVVNYCCVESGVKAIRLRAGK